MGDWGLLKASRSFEDDVLVSSGNYFSSVDNAGNNTKSAYVTAAASLAASICAILVECSVNTNVAALLDIAIGSAGNEVVVFPNLQLSGAAGGTHSCNSFLVFVSIPAGSRVALRSQSASTGFCKVKLQFISDTWQSMQSPQRWKDWGTDTANSRGTAITSGNPANTYAFSQLTASTDFTTRWLYWSVITAGSAQDNAFAIADGTQKLISGIRFTDEGQQNFLGPFPFCIPAGRQLQAGCASLSANTLFGYVQVYGGA